MTKQRFGHRSASEFDPVDAFTFSQFNIQRSTFNLNLNLENLLNNLQGTVHATCDCINERRNADFHCLF